MTITPADADPSPPTPLPQGERGAWRAAYSPVRYGISRGNDVPLACAGWFVYIVLIVWVICLLSGVRFHVACNRRSGGPGRVLAGHHRQRADAERVRPGGQNQG